MADLPDDLIWDDPRVQAAMPEGVTAEVTCPSVPNQIGGQIGGVGFYFRARHGWVSLGVGGEPVGSPDWEEGYEHPDAGWFTAAQTIDHLLALIHRYATRERGGSSDA